MTTAQSTEHFLQVAYQNAQTAYEQAIANRRAAFDAMEEAERLEDMALAELQRHELKPGIPLWRHAPRAHRDGATCAGCVA